MIKTRQPELNSPYVWKYISKKRRRPQPAPISKIRKMLRMKKREPSWADFIPISWSGTDEKRLWNFLGELSLQGGMSNRLFRRLLSPRKTSVSSLYLLWRVSEEFTDPARTYIRSKLRRVTEIRKLPFPRAEQPAVVPFLAHQSFRQNLRGFLHKLLRKAAQGLIPYHEPRGKVVESSWPKIGQTLFCHKHFLETFSFDDMPGCGCGRYRDRLPAEAWTTDGHLAADGASMALDEKTARVLTMNTNEPLWPEKKVAMKRLFRAMQAYITNNRVPKGMWLGNGNLTRELREFLRGEWDTHCLTIRGQRLSSMSDLNAVIIAYPDLVWQCEDHAYAKAMAFCPALYARMVYNTFVADTSVFSRVLVEPKVAERVLTRPTRGA